MSQSVLFSILTDVGKTGSREVPRAKTFNPFLEKFFSNFVFKCLQLQ